MRHVAALPASLIISAALFGCSSPTGPTEEPATCPPSGSPFAVRVVSWWEPECSLDQNRYLTPAAVLGPPDARRRPDGYSGFLSLGRGGYVTVEMGLCAVDGPGVDLRVYQAVSGEPVTVYASRERHGPFLLLSERRWCGSRMPGIFSAYCDFDLADVGLPEARFFKIKDGEGTPCRRAGTDSEGADIDAVELLHYSGQGA